jgi:hypothetical protein
MKAPTPTPTPMTRQHFSQSSTISGYYNTSSFFNFTWSLQYQQLFQFYLVHGHTNVTRRNADNSLAEWALYQRSKMGDVDKYDQKWKHLLNRIGFCSSPPPTLREAFGFIQSSPRNPECNHSEESRQEGPPWVVEILATTRKAISAGGGGSKIKDHDLQKIFDLYSAGIFSGISFEMQNGLPSRMHQLSITQGVSNSHPTLTNPGVPDSFQLSTDNDPKNYEVVEDGVPVSILLASGMNFPNDDMDKSDNNDPFHCDVMPSSSDEDKSASIKYLKRNLDLSLRSWDGVCFYNTERTLNNACIMAETFYRGNKKMHIHKQRSKIYKLVKFKQHNLAHLKYLQSMKNPTFGYSTDEESNEFGEESSFSEDDEDMLMVKSLDYKLRARKASEIRSLAQKNENKKARMAILELPGVEDEPGSGNHIVETDSSQ